MQGLTSKKYFRKGLAFRPKCTTVRGSKEASKSSDTVDRQVEVASVTGSKPGAREQSGVLLVS
jgi:hypothetical protein